MSADIPPHVVTGTGALPSDPDGRASLWDDRIKFAQTVASRAATLEFAKSYSSAYEAYIRAGQAYIFCVRNIDWRKPPDQSRSSPPPVPDFLRPRQPGAQRPSTTAASLTTIFTAELPADVTAARAQLKAAAAKVLQRAEKIKRARGKAADAPSTTSAHNFALAPGAVATGQLREVDRLNLAPEEQSYALSISTTINNARHPSWTFDPAPSEFEVGPMRKPFVDPDPEIPLCRAQTSQRVEYRRPSPLPLPPNASADDHKKEGITVVWDRSRVQPLSGREVVQDVVPDCTFVAALSVTAEHDRRWGSKLIASSLYPRDESGLPRTSANGKYVVKLLMNGDWRKITIDDRLPTYPDGRLACASTRDGRQLWPALLEKAYLKLMGGYDFGGSTSSIDLYALTGWVPEQIFLQNSDFKREKTWARILDGFRGGDCLITVGTAKKNERSYGPPKADATGLIPGHCYAVLDVRESAHLRQVVLMNPWPTDVRSSFMASTAEENEGEWTRELREALPDDVKETQGEFSSRPTGKESVPFALVFPAPSLTVASSLRRLVASFPLLPLVPSRADVFVVSWDQLCYRFESIYLNWNPDVFNHSLSIHSIWRGSVLPRSQSLRNVGQNPQYRLTVTPPPGAPPLSEKGCEVWLLLIRHVSRRNLTDSSMDWVTVHVFEQEDDRRIAKSRLAKKIGQYMNGTHTLIRFNAESKHGQYTLAVSRQGPAVDVVYTLSAYSTAALSLRDLPQTHAYSTKLVSNFNIRSAGGNATQPTFVNNPQYRLTIMPFKSESGETAPDQRADARFTLESARDQTICIHIVRGDGRRIGRLLQRDIVADSGEYDYALAVCDAENLCPGTYTVICSAFEAGQEGPITLRVESSLPFVIEPVPSEGAGMYSKVIKGEWQSGSTAGGGPSHSTYDDNPRYLVRIFKPGKFVFRMQASARITRSQFVPNTPLPPPPPLPPINLSLFPCTAVGTTVTRSHDVVASSGPYDDAPSGVIIDNVRLEPREYLLIASAFEPSMEANFEIKAYGDEKVDISRIGWVA